MRDPNRRYSLRKQIPARTATLYARWCRVDFVVMGPRWREARARMRRNARGICYWCKHVFSDGEMMALACFEHEGNHVLCQTCAEELLSHPEPKIAEENPDA